MSGRRLLVATGAAVADVEEVPAPVRGLLDAATDVLVITPILRGALQWLVSDQTARGMRPTSTSTPCSATWPR
jgi:hypothetical protein